MSKYKSVRTTIDNIDFDSKDESLYYLYLKEELKKGNIDSFELQPSFVLLDKQTYKGKKINAIIYRGDFLIIKNGKKIVVDTKGMATPEAKIKYKLFISRYSPEYELEWVARSQKYSDTGWIDWFKLQEIRRKAKKGAKLNEKTTT